jgi:hypothetical protein
MTALFQPRPIRQSPPDDRDLQIFKLAEIDRWTHEKIAEHVGGVTRRRVSQIVQEVRLWLANHPADDPALKTEIERKRLAQNLDRLRLEDVIGRAVNALNCAPASLAVTCSTEGGPVMRYVRDQPPVDVRLLKTYLRAVEALSKLNDRPEIPVPPAATHLCLDHRVQKVINFWKEKAEEHRLKSEYIDLFAHELMHAVIVALDLEDVDQPEPDSVVTPDQSASEESDTPTRSVSEGPATPARSASEGPGDQELSATSNASQTSQGEAAASLEPAVNSDDPNRCQRETCNDPPADEPVSQAAEPRLEKIEKGNAEGSEEMPDEPDQPPADSDIDVKLLRRQLEGAKVMEKRLLILIEDTPETNVEHRQSLQATLNNVRREKAAMELRIAPHVVGVAIVPPRPPAACSPPEPYAPPPISPSSAGT